MTIYDELVPYYDQLFPVTNQQASFFQELFHQPRPLRLLDAGCGTGRHLDLFVRWGIQVTGLEPAEVMANEARRRLAWAGEAAKVVRAPLGQAAEVLNGTFGAVVCVGNTLAHLTGPGELARGLRALSQVTAPGGILVSQTVHFEKVLLSRQSPFRDTVIETADGRTLTFSRHYDFRQAPKRLLFELSLTGPGTACADVIELRPLSLAEQTAALEDAGFAVIHAWGDWTRAPRHPEAPATILLARKMT